VHNDTTKQRKPRLDVVPDPARQILARRILEAGDLVQVAMIEALEGRLERGSHVGEIHHPTRVRIDLALKMQLYAERMPMKAGAFVIRRHLRQAMCSLDGEGSEQVHGSRPTTGYAPQTTA